ncbi:hypothetical protein [Nocardioides marinquilinus]
MAAVSLCGETTTRNGPGPSVPVVGNLFPVLTVETCPPCAAALSANYLNKWEANERLLEEAE